MNAYSTRINEKFPAWREDSKYYTPLLNMAEGQWINLPVLHNFLGKYLLSSHASPSLIGYLAAKMLLQLKSDSPRDPDGLFIIDEDSSCVKLFEIVMPFQDWTTVPLLVEFMEAMIR